MKPFVRFLFPVFFVFCLLLSAAGEEPVRFGYSFNEGTNRSGGATDYYGVINGAWTGTWAPPPDGGSTYFRPGFSGEEGDYSITSAGNRIRVDANSILGTDWGSFTIEAHFTIGESGAFRRMVEIEGYRIALQKNSANQLRTSMGTTNTGGTIQTGVLTEDQWYHAAVVYDAASEAVTLYLDGAQVGSGPAHPWTSPVFLYLASGPTGGSPWNGTIDNFRFTAAALTPEEFLLDGFGTDLTEPPPPPEPLPDAAELQLFWTELDLGEIRSGRADGTGRATLVTGLNRPIGVQVDQENGYIYWSEDGELGEPANGRIGRARLDGSEVTILYAATEAGQGLDNPQHLAIDVAGGMVYWADFTTGIYRAPIDGSGPVESVHFASSDRFTNLALDLVNQHVYFGDPQYGYLWRSDLNGGNFQWIAFDLTNSWGFNGLAVDPVAGRLYFPDTNAIRAANLDGSDNVQIGTGLSSPLGVALGPDRERVFFAERGGQRQVGVAYVDGSRQQPLLTGLDNPFGIAVIRLEATGTTFQQWLAAHFDPEELADEELSGPSATPAGDGIPNLLKFALGLAPKVPSRGYLPQALLLNGSLQVSYTRAKDVIGVEVIAEVSTDLVAWHSGPDYLEIDEVEVGDLLSVTATVTPASLGEDRAFIRIRAVPSE